MIVYHLKISTIILIMEWLNFLDARPQLLKPPLFSNADYQDGEGATIESVVKRSVITDEDLLDRSYNKSSHNLRKAKRRGERTDQTIIKSKFLGGISYSEKDIIFPDELLFETVPRIQGAPKCAEGSTFCENFELYPYRHVEHVLQRNKLYSDLFGKDEAPIEISNRNGNEDMFLCGAIDRTIFPKIGKTKNSKWKYIINQGEEQGFVQGVKIEICRTHGRPCDIIGELPNGYVTTCKQKYVYRRLLSLSETGTPVPESFQLPSACCCSYKRNFDFMARFGAPVTPAKIRR